MFRKIVGKSETILFCSVVPVVATSTTATPANSTENAENEVKEFVFVETGWDRVRNIFRPTQYEVISPDLQKLSSGITNVVLLGGAMGSFIFSRHTYMDFMSNCHPDHFGSHLEAKAVLTNRMIQSMIRGAIIWGGRGALLTLSWMLTTRIISAYRNEKGLHDKVSGGVITGALAGYLFRDLQKIQIAQTFKQGRFIGGPLSVVGGAAAGCLIGGALGAVQLYIIPKSNAPTLRQWEQFWQAREQEKRKKDPNYKPDN